MNREQMKSLFIVHTNGQDKWIKVDKRTYDKAIDMFCDAHKTELKVKEEKHGDELQALLNDMGRAISKLSGELKAKDEELGVAKKVAQDAYTLGASQTAEMDRFWAEFGLLDENISVDDAIAFFKAKDERIAELEAIAQKMKHCGNCRYEDDNCIDKNCHNFSEWRLKDNK